MRTASPTTARARSNPAARREQVLAELIQTCQDADLSALQLNDVVSDCADRDPRSHPDSSANGQDLMLGALLAVPAAVVNSGGVSAQVEFLLAALGQELLREVLADVTAQRISAPTRYL